MGCSRGQALQVGCSRGQPLQVGCSRGHIDLNPSPVLGARSGQRTGCKYIQNDQGQVALPSSKRARRRCQNLQPKCIYAPCPHSQANLGMELGTWDEHQAPQNCHRLLTTMPRHVSKEPKGRCPSCAQGPRDCTGPSQNSNGVVLATTRPQA